MKNQNNGNLNTQIKRYFAIKIRLSLKMQKIIKQKSPSRQLFFFFFWRFASCVTTVIQHLIWAEMHDANLSEKGGIPYKRLF